MIELIEQRHDEIEKACKKYHVGRLEVFGSAADGTFDPSRSDVDFLVEFQRIDEIDAADQYFGLLEEFQAVLGRRVNLVCIRAMRNPYFIRSVDAGRRLLYAVCSAQMAGGHSRFRDVHSFRNEGEGDGGVCRGSHAPPRVVCRSRR